jgi:hypothetical protein
MKLADGFDTFGRRPRVRMGPIKLCVNPTRKSVPVITLPITRKEDSSGIRASREPEYQGFDPRWCGDVEGQR